MNENFNNKTNGFSVRLFREKSVSVGGSFFK